MAPHIALPIREYKQFISHRSLKMKVRTFVRDGAVVGLSYIKRVPLSSNWIRFPYYHHVSDDEQQNFHQQLSYMRNFGDFISLDDVISMVNQENGKLNLHGRFFCLTFDDGFKSCITNAMPILQQHGAKATFFIATKFIESNADKYVEQYNTFFSDESFFMEFLSWDDCRKIVSSGMSIGSHTVTHRTLISLSESEVEQELKDSKEKIEKELGITCQHFCAPVGIPGKDFIVNRDPLIVKKTGYKSFLTTQRGVTVEDFDPLFVKRDSILPSWSVSQLRYFFSR